MLQYANVNILLYVYVCREAGFVYVYKYVCIDIHMFAD